MPAQGSASCAKANTVLKQASAFFRRSSCADGSWHGSAQAVSDSELGEKIGSIRDGNYGVYAARKTIRSCTARTFRRRGAPSSG